MSKLFNPFENVLKLFKVKLGIKYSNSIGFCWCFRLKNKKCILLMFLIKSILKSKYVLFTLKFSDLKNVLSIFIEEFIFKSLKFKIILFLK